MVSWAADGKLAGYDPTTKRLSPTAFTFDKTTPVSQAGVVDLNGATRLHYSVPGNAATFPNRLSATVSFTFTADDALNTGSNQFLAGMFVVPASAFPPGKQPTPDEIIPLFNAAGTGPGQMYISSLIYTGPGTYNHVIDGFQPSGFLTANTKFWVLLLPLVVRNNVSERTIVNYPPIGPFFQNGRVLSVWTNRAPAAPVITSPVNNTTVAPGDSFNFTFTSGDADKATPVDTQKYNTDLAGVHVQYAAVPSLGNENPPWMDLEYRNAAGAYNTAWFVRGSAKNNSAGMSAMLENLGMPILCGSQVAGTPTNRGILPGGKWQIRVRTFDFGHPYPAELPALGVTDGRYGALNYPPANTSPWSDPVKVSVPSQVAPPIPLYPTDNIAVQENTTPRLSWQYRNTFRPPYPQSRRWVQIRKISDTVWKTIFAGVSTNAFVDLPPVLDNPTSVPDSEYLSDFGFEAGTLGGWAATPAQGSAAGSAMAPANVNDPSRSFAGNRHLNLYYAGSSTRQATLTNDGNVVAGHDTFRITGRLFPSPLANSYNFVAFFFDGGGNVVGSKTMSETGHVGAWSWLPIDITAYAPGAVTYKLFYSNYDSAFVNPQTMDVRIDNMSMVGSASTNTDDFTLEATTQYEWRVRTEDSTGVQSDYSSPARFWIVPAVNSGEVQPLPSETIQGATLGSGTHRVFVYRRGGTVRVGEITGLSYVDYGRVRDDISTSKIVISDWGIDGGNLLSLLQSWAYEIVIFRNNGFTVDRVWEGPITLLTYETDSVTIQAKDVMAYPYRRIIKQIMNDSGVKSTVVDRAMRVMQNVMAPDDPNVLAYLTPIVNPDSDTVQYRSIPAYSRTAFEEIDDMAANQGLDYTAVGRAVLFWGTKNRIGTLPEMHDRDFGSPPIVSEYGMSMANRYVISDGNGVWGEATRGLDPTTGIDPIYGLVEMLSSSWASDSNEDVISSSTKVVQSFRDSSDRSINDRYMPGAPVVVRVPDNTSINPDTPISIQQLVPGVIIPLRSVSTLRTVAANQKLDAMKVVETAGTEAITITLSPFGRDDNEEVGATE